MVLYGKNLQLNSFRIFDDNGVQHYYNDLINKPLIQTQSLQDTYNNSTNPEIVTDATRGAVSIKRGSTADTDNVLEIIDGSGVIKSKFDGYR